MEENRLERRLANFAAGREAGPRRVKGEIAGAAAREGKDGCSPESPLKLQSWPPCHWSGGGEWGGGGGALMGKPELGKRQGACRVYGGVGELSRRLCWCDVRCLVEPRSGGFPPAMAPSQVVINKCLSQD